MWSSFAKYCCLSGYLSMIPAVHAFHDGSREMPAAFSPGPDFYKWYAVVTPQDRGFRQKGPEAGTTASCKSSDDS